MKRISNRTGGLLPALILAVMLVLGLTGQKAQAQDYYDDYGNGDYQEFYDDLSPYGQWFNDPQYGYVWMPNAGGDFRPYYTNGRWVMTEYGNTWVSDYAWGWAPFHYGRWAQGMYGWVWIPGSVWGPAWVNWRQGGGYYGWAPMGPGVSINISFGNGFNVPNPWWTFIPCGNIYSSGWQRYYSPRRTVNIINNTTIINNTYVDNRSRNRYVTGPRRSDIEATTRQRVNVYNVSNRSRSGATNISGRTVNVYRPDIGRTSGRGQVSAPRQVRTLERSAITNTGGGRGPSREAVQRNTGMDRSEELRNTQQRNQQAVPQRGIQRDQQQRNNRLQRDQQTQQADRQPDMQMQQQRTQQAQQQRNAQIQRDQQMQQQRIQRDQQMQQQRIHRDQQMQQQRIQQDQQMQRDQQMQQQRMQRDQQMQQQRIQRDQQMQQQRIQRDQQMQERRQMDIQRAPQQRMERQTPSPQPQRMERSSPVPQQRNVERAAPRGR